MTEQALRASDAVVVARYLQLRSIFERLLARVEGLIQERYDVEATRRIHPTLVAVVRAGFVPPGEGEVWPVVFLTPVDISVALCVRISPERLAGLGTMLNGPQRLRHRHWEDWWGWEKPAGLCHAQLFDLPSQQQDDALVAWYAEGLEWLVNAGLMRRK